MSAQCIFQSKINNVPTFAGKVNGRRINTALRDTGSNVVIVAKYLVKDKNLIDCQVTNCYMADGTKIQCPKTTIFVESPYFTGYTEALVFANPTFPLILGNLDKIPFPAHTGEFQSSDDSQSKQTNHTSMTSKAGNKRSPGDSCAQVKQTAAQREFNADHTARATGDTRTYDITRTAVSDRSDDVTRATTDIGGCDSNQNNDCCKQTANVATRKMTEKLNKPSEPLQAPIIDGLNLSPDDISKLQREDDSLRKFFKQADDKTIHTTRRNESISYTIEDNILFRRYQSPLKTGPITYYKQIVVPKSLKERLIKVAHESTFSGHLSAHKVYLKLIQDFFWVGMTKDIANFTQSCIICQRVGFKPKRVPIGEPPIVDAPFQKISIDLLGAIHPASDENHTHVLVVVDHATRYVLAECLTKIDSVSIADALLKMFAHTGFPDVVVSDQGSNFCSNLMKEVFRILSIKHEKMIVEYHASNGIVERWIRSIRSVLSKLTFDKPHDWHRYIPAVLFVLREMPSWGGYSSFELLYGRTVKGVTGLLKSLWTNKATTEEKTSYWYIFDLVNKMTETAKVCRKICLKTQAQRKFYYDKHSKSRKLNVNDEVFVLLPVTDNKLLLHYAGPYKITQKLSGYKYVVKIKGREKVFHINMLKLFKAKSKDDKSAKHTAKPAVASVQISNSVIVEENDCSKLHVPNTENDSQFSWTDVKISDQLSEKQHNEVKQLLEK